MQRGYDTMELVIGGAYQGKTDYILNLYNLSLDDVADGYLSDNKKVIIGLERIIYTMLKENNNPIDEIEKFLLNNDDKIIICTEIGGGLVPIDKFDRDYRDMVGKVTSIIAKKSNKIHRVWCGIGEIIKDV